MSLNVKPETIKLLEGSIREYVGDLWFDNEF